MNPPTETPRLRADALRNRERIITGAAALIAERGPDVPMEDIAQRAGVGVGTLYRRFPDRHSLVREVAAAMFREAGAAAEAALAQEASGWEALARLVRRCADPGLGALSAALRPWLSEHRDADPALRALTGAWVEGFGRAVARAQEEGVMRTDIDGPELLRYISLVTCRMPELPEGANREAAARYLDILLDGLRRREAE